MTAYAVLATRYRPRRFEDVVGQEDAARVLREAVTGGRLAHAYLFSGPRGVGKTSMARILAKAVNCTDGEPGAPCGACALCRAIDGSGDVLDVVEIDGASHNKVENVRELIENVRFRPAAAQRRVYIIDEVHMLSISAFNALLKTLEEPPEHALFVLATTEPLKVPETIRSRCQTFDFRRLSAAEIARRLEEVCAAEEAEVDGEVLARIARHARGGMRDALSLLDQLLTFSGGSPGPDDFERLTGQLSPAALMALVEAALDEDTAAILAACDAAFDRGVRGGDLVAQLTEVLEGLLVCAAGGEPADRTDEERAALAALAERATVDRLCAMLDVLVEAAARLRQRHDPRLVVEMALVQLGRLRNLESIADALARVPAGGGAPAPTPRAAEAEPAPREEDPKTRLLGALGRSFRLHLEPARVALDGRTLRVAVPGGGLAWGEPPASEQLAEAARAAFGKDVRVEVVVAGGAGGAAEPERPDPPRAARGGDDELVRRVLEDWPGSEEVDI